MAASTQIRRIHALIRKSGEPLPPIGDRDYGGISGTLSPSSKLLVMKVMEETEYPVTAFVDLGCGFGEMLYSVAKKWSDASVTGVEFSKMIVDHAKSSTKWIKGQMSIENPERVIIYHQDILEMTDFSAFSHVFCFAVGMPQEVVDHILDLAQASQRSFQLLLVLRRINEKWITSRFPSDYHDKRTVTMAGSREQHTLWTIQFRIPPKVEEEEEKEFYYCPASPEYYCPTSPVYPF